MGPGSLDDYRFVGRRRRLIEDIRDQGIDDLDLLQLFDKTPRHLFIPEGMWHRAYEDAPVPIGYGQTASQPSLQARYLEILEPGPDDTVLEIGTGSGYLTALLARAAERVYSIERVRELSVRARRALDDLEMRNVALMVGDGSIGWRKFAPFDIIVVSAASPSVPDALVEQLAEGGRMLIPVGSREEQELTLVRREAGRGGETGAEAEDEDGERDARKREGEEVHERKAEVTVESVQDRCTFVPLLGRYGWKKKEDER